MADKTVEAGLIVNTWIGTGTISGLEYAKELGKYRFFLKVPSVIKDHDGDDALHMNLFSINMPKECNDRMADYKDGDLVYLEGFLAQSDRSRSVKIKARYIRHFNQVTIKDLEA